MVPIHAKSRQALLPSLYCAVSGLSLRHVSLQPLQVRSESMCLEDPSTNRDPGLVGSAPTSYALKTHAQWLLTGSVTKILFQKEGTTLALQTQQPLLYVLAPQRRQGKSTQGTWVTHSLTDLNLHHSM